MDGTTISNVMSQNLSQYAIQAQNSAAAKSYGAASTAQDSTAQSSAVGAAFEVEISDAAKKAQQTVTESQTTENNTSEAKGLTTEQVDYLKQSIAINQQTMLNMMIQALTDSNNKLQGWLDSGTGILNFGGVQIDAARFGLPEVATNPEDAAKAVGEGGDWSVSAVSDRIFSLAEAMAGGDPDKLQEMRAAVEEGFKQAGATWSDATGLDNMPDITQKTYNELMNRFDAYMAKITG